MKNFDQIQSLFWPPRVSREDQAPVRETAAQSGDDGVLGLPA